MSQYERDGRQGSGEERIGALELGQKPGGTEEIDLVNLLKVIWRRKAWIVLATSLMTLVAVVHVLTATEWYRAEVVLVPRESRPSGSLSAQFGQLAGFADIAGLSLGQASKQEALALLRSAGFARRFVERNGLLSKLSREFAPRVMQGGDKQVDLAPHLVDAFRQKVLTISEDKKTGLIIVAIEWTDPLSAAKWANAIPRQLNAEMQGRVLNEGAHNLRYLKSELASAETVSLEQAIARLMESETQQLMLAQGAEDYALRVIDDAQEPHKRSRPKRTMIVFLVSVSGLLLSLLVAVLYDPFRGLLRGIEH